MRLILKIITFAIVTLAAGFNINNTRQAYAKELINLTLESAVDIAMSNSYSIKQLELEIERTRCWLKAEQASLKSRVYMNLTAPEFDSVGDYKWNSILKKDEIIRQNTRRWQMDISVKQPVILLGYPTNGYLSLNNKTYKYLQKEDQGKDVDYYNRFFMKFEQPILQPNELKNDLENAELNVKREELEYIRDRVNLANSISSGFFELYDLYHRNIILSEYARELKEIYEIACDAALDDTAREIEKVQAQIELANAQEKHLKNQSDFRLELLNMKQRLRLDVKDSLSVNHDMALKRIEVDINRALQYGYTMRPHLKILNIDKREREISYNDSKGWDSFHLNLEITLGFEKNEDRFRAIWDEYDNSYSVSVNAYVPIWDWGRSKAWVNAERINVKRAELNIEENRDSLKSSINTTIKNLEDYQNRALNLRESLKMAREISVIGIRQYRENKTSLQDVLQVIDKQCETEINFLIAYLGFRSSLEHLKSLTFYDFENEVSLLDKFRDEN